MHVTIQEVGIDVAVKRVLWLKARPDYEPLFSIFERIAQNSDRRFLAESFVTQEYNCNTEEVT